MTSTTTLCWLPTGHGRLPTPATLSVHSRLREGSGDQAFADIDPTTTYSLYIQPDRRAAQDERLLSKGIAIREKSVINFYTLSSASATDNWNFTISVVDGKDTTLVYDNRAFMKEQGDSYDASVWHNHNVSLARFAGKTVRLLLRYAGRDGNNLYVDNFEVRQAEAEGNTVAAFIDDKVNFVNQSAGNGTLTYAWTFEGGTPATSTEENPTVTYYAPGTFGVTLTVTAGAATDTKTIKGFVKVSYKKPVAAAVFPDSIYTAFPNSVPFVESGNKVTLVDASTNHPQKWHWEILDSKNNVVATSDEPTITASLDGSATGAVNSSAYYKYTLTVSNEGGEDTFRSASQAIKVGGYNEIWNVSKEEKPNNSLAYFLPDSIGKGYLGGANDAGITAWAEKFNASAADSINVNDIFVAFYRGTTESGKAYTISLRKADANGNPGELIAGSDQVKTIDSKNMPNASGKTWGASTSKCVKVNYETDPLKIGEPFFVVIEGLPEYKDGANQVAVASVLREGAGAKNTAYMLRNGVWQPSPVAMSLGIFPRINFAERAMPKAAFTAKEAANKVLDYGFDADSIGSGWTTQTGDSASTGWRTLHYAAYDLINPLNKKSAYIQGDAHVAYNDNLVSPEVTIPANATLEFYTIVSRSATTSLAKKEYDLTANLVSGTDTVKVFSLADWTTQPNTPHVPATWEKVTVDLSAYAGKTANLDFNYRNDTLVGRGGLVYLDDVQLLSRMQPNDVVTVALDDTVHFVNETEALGGAYTYSWQFPGGTPSESTEKNPVVVYATPGTYDVSLSVTRTIKSGTGRNAVTTTEQSDTTRTGFVTARYQRPVAAVGEPDNAFRRRLSGGSIMVAPGKPVTFHDASTNHPTYWRWEFKDSKNNVIYTSTEPDVTVQFDTVLAERSAYYKYTLTVGNEAGEDTYASQAQTIQVGGANYIWNFDGWHSSGLPNTIQYYNLTDDESQGYFGGSNTEGITMWAEKFVAPLDTAAVTMLTALFPQGKGLYPRGTNITLSLYTAGPDGLPAQQILGSNVSKAAGDLTWSSRTISSGWTRFPYDDNYPIPLLPGQDFFVVIEGIPPYVKGSSEIALASKQMENGRGTVYCYQNGEWKEAPYGNMTLFLSPYLTYSKSYVDKAVTTGIREISQDADVNAPVEYYDLSGRRLPKAPAAGLYIQKQGGKVVKRVAR